MLRRAGLLALSLAPLACAATEPKIASPPSAPAANPVPKKPESPAPPGGDEEPLQVGAPAEDGNGSRVDRRVKVVSGGSTVDGMLPQEAVLRVVRRSFARFRYCYEKGLLEDKALRGTVKTRFSIGPDGSVKAAVSMGSTMPDKAVVACVLSVFESMTFPEPERGTVNVAYAVVFDVDYGKLPRVNRTEHPANSPEPRGGG